MKKPRFTIRRCAQGGSEYPGARFTMWHGYAVYDNLKGELVGMIRDCSSDCVDRLIDVRAMESATEDCEHQRKEDISSYSGQRMADLGII